MRIIFYGLSDLTKKTATRFIEEGHEVLIIDPSRELIDDFSEEVDCGFVAGNASHPAVLKECNPEETDYFFALSDDNEINMVSCLVAKSLGVERTILCIDDPEIEDVCLEIGLQETVIPSQIVSQHLFDAIFNEHMMELFQQLKDKICLHRVTVGKDMDRDKIKSDLCDDIRIVCYFRDGSFYHFEEFQDLKEGDELILLTSFDHQDELRERFNQNRHE